MASEAEVRTDIKQRYSFRNSKTLGEGASCKVVSATHIEENVKFAVKIMSKSRHIHECMFNQELAILQKLDHPNIIRFKEAGVDERDFYIITHYNSGGELFDRIVGDDYEMSESTVAKIVKDMLQALRHLHEKNIVHRDLKPENWLFDSPSPDANIILIDFGTALEVEDEAQYTDLVGTPFYLAPESATNAPFRTGQMLKASDIWAIGVIAYICLTGTPPFYGNSNRDICRAIVKQKLRFPPNVEISNGLKDFCYRALQKRWNKRMPMDEAIMHPWVIGVSANKNKINLDTLRSLRQFQHQSKLKKAVAGILAANMGEGPEKRVREHFNRLDIDGDQQLDLAELKTLIKDLGFHDIESESEAERMLKEADKDLDGHISFEEFATVWQRKLLTVNDQYIRAVFGVLDSNGDGFICADELQGVLEGFSAEEVEDMIKEIDEQGGNGDGKIDFSEFKQAMKEQIKKAGFQPANAKLTKEDLTAEEIVDEGNTTAEN